MRFGRTKLQYPWVFPIMTFATFVSLGACSSRSHQPTAPKDARKVQTQTFVAPPERMPDFTLKDATGREVSLAQFHGKVLLIDFWATWCAPCKKEMPGYEDLYRRYKRAGLMVIGVAADSDASAVAKFGKKLGVSYPLLVNGMDVQRYGVLGLPTTILIDREGFIRKKVVGFEYKEVFETALTELLEKPVPGKQ